ncbi:7594_t:CDS:2, partial [Gigaspora margarita]
HSFEGHSFEGHSFEGHSFEGHSFKGNWTVIRAIQPPPNQQLHPMVKGSAICKLITPREQEVQRIYMR